MRGLNEDFTNGTEAKLEDPTTRDTVALSAQPIPAALDMDVPPGTAEISLTLGWVETGSGGDTVTAQPFALAPHDETAPGAEEERKKIPTFCDVMSEAFLETCCDKKVDSEDYIPTHDIQFREVTTDNNQRRGTGLPGL